MKATFRNSGIFARPSGDEFVTLLSNTSKEQAEQLIEISNRALTKHNQEANQEYDI